MSRPQPSRAAATAAAAAMSGAVDLSGLKERAQRPTPPAGPAAGAAGGEATASYVVDVTEATFESQVIERSQHSLVIVELLSPGSEQCDSLTATLEALAHNAGGSWTLAKVDINVSPRVAQAFGAQSVPTVIALVQGQPVSAFQGAQPAAQIQGWIDDIMTKLGDKLPGNPAAAQTDDDPGDPRLEQAADLLDQGDFEGAIAAYQNVLTDEPDNVEAKSALANLRFIARAKEHDQNVVTTAADDSLADQLAAADVELLAQQPVSAFDRLIAFIKRSSGDERTAARKRLLELFELFDPAEDFVVAARRKLASALY